MAHSGDKLDAFLVPEQRAVFVCNGIIMANNLKNHPALDLCPGAQEMLLQFANTGPWLTDDFFTALRQTFADYALWATLYGIPGIEEAFGDDFPDLIRAMLADEVSITTATRYWARLHD